MSERRKTYGRVEEESLLFGFGYDTQRISGELGARWDTSWSSSLLSASLLTASGTWPATPAV